MKINILLVQLFLLKIMIIIGLTKAGRLCDFASKFPCKGDHCYPLSEESTKQTETAKPISTTDLQATSSAGTTQTETAKPISTTDLQGISSTGTTQTETAKPISTTDLQGISSAGTKQTETAKPISTTDLQATSSSGTTQTETAKPISTTDLQGISSAGTTQTETAKPISTTDLQATSSAGSTQGTGNPAGTTELLTAISPVLYTDCQDVYDADHIQNGVYVILPPEWPGSSFSVYCNMDNGGGWTVFQRRMDNNTSFYQDWIAYKEGFGDNSGNVWLGNEKLHYLTTGKNFMLRIDITTADGQPLYAEYTEFAIESETTNYRMNKLGTHSGNTGNALSRNKGKYFSTHDNDNDGCTAFNCADRHRSGWWHTDAWCFICWHRVCSGFESGSCYFSCTGENLNGDYNGTSGENIFSIDDVYCNISFVEMKIRPTT
ncbi:uncharacterized protein [Apostichopus japonicus]|uniref:uncharacterized protein isoform X2 n=1 Tax=Stichopus japonicus TaxID=307972 RepID=UPI003AB2CA97